MEYTVGSLADLITGSNTPNKPKVLKKQFKKDEVSDLKIKKVIKSNDGLKKKSKGKGLVSVHSKMKFKKQKASKKQIDSTELTSENKGDKPRKKKKERKHDESQVDLADRGEVGSPEINKKIILNGGLEKHLKANNSIRKIKKRKASEKQIDSTELTTENKVDESRKEKKERKRGESQADLADSGDETPTKKSKPSENDLNAERRVKNKIKEEKRVLSDEELARTIFVGNVPITTDKKVIKRHFKKYGTIESLRFRGIPVADPKVTKKVAAIKKEFHPDRSSIYCYIRFANQEDAIKAEAENGALFKEHHLRVHTCTSETKPDESKAIFVGNLSFSAEEEDLWKLFEPCGPISHVRIIRDKRTGMGKGFAYINFLDSDSVQLALEMENVKLKNRELRIALSNLNTAKKNKKQGKNKPITKPGKPNVYKSFNKNKGGQKKPEGDASEKFQKQQGVTDTGFQGSKFNDKKKKYKVNKGAMEKKRKVKKIAPHVN